MVSPGQGIGSHAKDSSKIKVLAVYLPAGGIILQVLISLIRLPFVAAFRLILLGLWLFGLGVLVWLPLRLWPGDDFLPVQLGNYIMPWLLLGLLPGVLVAVMARRRWLSLVLAAPALIICASYAPLFLPRIPPALADNSQHLKVMSFNVWRLNENLDQVAGLVEHENPEVLLLQEVSPQMAQQVQTYWQAAMPDSRLYLETDAYSQQAIISRHPLSRIDSSYREGRALKVLVETPAGPVQVWNVHTSQPIAWRYHQREFTALTNALPHTTGPLIVGGDFNTTDQSEMYGLINQYLRNAHWDAGWGFGFSFPADVRPLRRVRIPTPLIRIDHVFYNDYFFARSARTLSNSGGSDHFPIVAEFIFTPPQ